MDERPTPADTDVPGGFPVTPSMISTNQTPLAAEQGNVHHDTTDLSTPTQTHPQSSYFLSAPNVPSDRDRTPSSSDTVTNRDINVETKDPVGHHRANQPSHGRTMSSASSGTATDEDSPVLRTESRFMPLKSAPSADQRRPSYQHRKSIQTEDDLFRVLSRRKTNASGKSEAELQEENDEIERLMSRMFGKARQEQSEEAKTRHSGVIFRNLTVRGVGLGASLQPTVGDIFMGLPRMLNRLFTKGTKAAAAKPPVRELLSNFDGCVRPGEMLLVLGRPGSGCSTFLKAFCNQRAGFESVEGDVSYGGTSADRMKKDFRGEVIYNPEDDLHYATLTVKRTLTFALETRTPGKESRMEGESREDYMKEFLRVVTKLFWIEHTLNTKVGDQFVRGVSGGEKKRVSIAEGKLSLTCVSQ